MNDRTTFHAPLGASSPVPGVFDTNGAPVINVPPTWKEIVAPAAKVLQTTHPRLMAEMIARAIDQGWQFHGCVMHHGCDLIQYLVRKSN